MVSLSYNSLTTLINREDLSAFTSFLNNRNVAVDDRDDVSIDVARKRTPCRVLSTLL